MCVCRAGMQFYVEASNSSNASTVSQFYQGSSYQVLPSAALACSQPLLLPSSPAVCLALLRRCRVPSQKPVSP